MKKRLFWIDLLRLIGMLGVIIIHIVGNTINTLGLSGNYANVYTIISNSCYFVLPLFVMISGALLLSKDISYKDIIFKYIKRMILVLLTFGSLFAFMEEYFISHSISIKLVLNIFRRILENGLWDHMWYIYLLIALYLITPLLRKYIKNSTKDEQISLLIILFIFTILLKDISNIINLKIAFYIPISTGFIFSYLFGNYLFNNCLSTTNKKLLNIFGILSIILIIILTYLNKCTYLIGYTTTLCIVESAFVFYSIKDYDIRSNKVKKIILSLGECSFGIYIMHQFFINILYKVLKFDIILKLPYVFLFIYVLGILIITYIAVYCIRKINFIKKYIL